MYLLIYCITYIEEESIHYANFNSEDAMNLSIKKFKEDEKESGMLLKNIKLKRRLIKYEVQRKVRKKLSYM